MGAIMAFGVKSLNTSTMAGFDGKERSFYIAFTANLHCDRRENKNLAIPQA